MSITNYLITKKNDLMNLDTRKQINKNFVIRLKHDDGKPTHIVGAGQLHKHIGVKMSDKLANEALIKGVQVYSVKLRRGIRIEFHSK